MTYAVRLTLLRLLVAIASSLLQLETETLTTALSDLLSRYSVPASIVPVVGHDSTLATLGSSHHLTRTLVSLRRILLLVNSNAAILQALRLLLKFGVGAFPANLLQIGG